MSLISFADVVPIEESEVTENESFQIDSYEKAEWALERAGEAQSVINQIEAEAEAMIERIRQARDEKTKSLYQTVERMAYFLDPWARGETEKIKKKTIPLAMGEIKIITGRESLKVDWDDEGELVDFLTETNPEFVRTKTTESLDKAALKKAIKEGLKIDGCSVVRGPDRMEIKPKLREIE
jgi:phage host-nuclease inhibitor protein Gam